MTLSATRRRTGSDLLGHEHGAESALTNLLEQAIGADLRPGHFDGLRRTGLTKLGAVCGVGHGWRQYAPMTTCGAAHLAAKSRQAVVPELIDVKG